jgi:acetolactate synthase-1/2/3 large subunit
MARAFGMHAERVEDPAQLDAAIDRALTIVRGGAPALLDVRVTADAVSADAKSGLAWVPDLQPLAAWDAAERRWRATPSR